MSDLDTQPAQQRCIGVFDSGLGGLTVVRELVAAMPAEDIVYLGDTARVPYGIKSLVTVRRFASEDAAFLMRFSPKLMVVACNTASAAAHESLISQCSMDVVDVIRPGVAKALSLTDGTIGVIATEATVSSGAYQNAISALSPGRGVVAVPCPLLVPIVEEGRDENDPIVLAVLSDYLRTLQRCRPGALILGCTHYPLLVGPIGRLMGPDVQLVSSAQAAAQEVQRRLLRAGMENRRSGDGFLRCFTTDAVERFARVAQRFCGRRIDQVEFVGTDELTASFEYKTE